MYDLGVFQIKPIKKSKNCGEVLGKYHPMEIHLFMTLWWFSFRDGYAVSIWTDSQRTLDYTCNDKIASNAAETKMLEL
jgi:hypothetical protein